MKQLEVRLNLEVVAPLVELVRAGAEELRPALAREPEVPGADAELATHWRDDLLQAQGADLDTLLGLFVDDFPLTGRIVLDEENCESVLRAAAALRLRLHATGLHQLGDERLESGDLTPGDLPEALQLPYAAYIFLATLQDLIVRHLELSTDE